MHSKNVIHRDIKSLNILMNSQGEIKVADMGMSAFNEDWQTYRKTRAGTAFWQAPEILNGRSYTKNVDVYSFGCLAYEVATGHPPHANVDHKNVAKLILSGQLPEPISEEQYSNLFWHLITVCLSFKPTQRP